MDLKKLKSFIEFMDQNNLSELEIEEDKQRIRLKKYEGQKPDISYEPIAKPAPKKPDKVKSENKKEIKSPMVGTFYRSSSPGADPYVEVGQAVKKDDVICIIEAMKVMNEIKADSSGEIDKILVEDGQPVEFGQALFSIK